MLDADIDKAWEDAEGLMGGEGSHMYIHIGEIATRLCSVITASNNAAADDLSSAPSTGHPNRNPDPLSNTSTTDGEDHSYHHDDYSSESLLVSKQPKHRHLSKSKLDDPELVWNTVWPNTSGVAYKDEDELPVPANNPSGDLVKAYLQLADIANKQRV
ncbi:hypothetical protein LPJ72_004425 [Coemansia sp. Benny D160-2]|nr:hypothetical protein LPJ72_004425 [Coemansia sp. Benny D160-2]